AWLADGRSMIDLFGQGFTLLRLGEPPPAANVLTDAARARRIPLGVVSISDPAIASLYQRRLVLVRPDGHVAWRGDTCPADPLAILARARGAAPEHAATPAPAHAILEDR